MSSRLFLVIILVHNAWFLIINQYHDLVFSIADIGGDSNRNHLALLYLNISQISLSANLEVRCLIITLFLVLNNTVFVMLVLRDNLFALIQSTAYLFIFLSAFSISSKLLTSVKWWTGLFSIAWWRSLINIIKRNRPPIESHIQ